MRRRGSVRGPGGLRFNEPPVPKRRLRACHGRLLFAYDPVLKRIGDEARVHEHLGEWPVYVLVGVCVESESGRNGDGLYPWFAHAM